jgi:plastocyanin
MRRRIIALIVSVITASALIACVQTALAGGGGCHQGTTQGTGTRVDLTGICFSPTILYVQPGATVTWTNRDALQHEVVGTGWSSGPTTLQEGQTITQTFPTAGIFPYSCPLHYGMNAVVIVGDGKASVPLAVVQPAAAATAATASPHPGSNPWPFLALVAAIAAGAVGYGLGRRPTVTRP